MNRNPLLPVALAALTSCLLLAAGCGKPPASGKGAASGPASSELKVIAKALTDGDAAAEVTALLLTEKALFVGTKKGVRALKLEVGKDGKGEFTDAGVPLTEPAIKNYEVHAIRRDGDKVHVATEDGLATFDGRGWSSESMGPVLDVATYDKTLWIARNRGLEKKTNDWREEKVPGITVNPGLCQRVKSLAVLPDTDEKNAGKPRLWVGSEFGIYSFQAADKKWGQQLYGDYNNIQGDMVMPEKGNCELCYNVVNQLVAQQDGGKLLVCTAAGLSVFDGKDSWKKYQGDYEDHTAETGLKSRVKKKGNLDLPSASISTALLTGNTVWIGMSEGLARVDGDKIQLFDANTDLPGSAVRALAHDPATGVLYVGTDHGLAALAPVPGGGPAPKADSGAK